MLLAIAAHSVVGEDVEDSDDISQLLGMRPDLADALDGSDASSRSNGGAAENTNNQLECINGCKPTDQSCRARCLGVPGGASRKVPRKQDISGNLPLNWRVAKDEAIGSPKKEGVDFNNIAATTPALGNISMVLTLASIWGMVS